MHPILLLVGRIGSENVESFCGTELGNGFAMDIGDVKRSAASASDHGRHLFAGIGAGDSVDMQSADLRIVESDAVEPIRAGVVPVNEDVLIGGKRMAVMVVGDVPNSDIFDTAFSEVEGLESVAEQADVFKIRIGQRVIDVYRKAGVGHHVADADSISVAVRGLGAAEPIRFTDLD